MTALPVLRQQADGTYLSQGNSQLTTVAVLSPSYVNFSLSENDRLSYRTEIEKGLLREPEDHKYIVEIVLADGSIFPHHRGGDFFEPHVQRPDRNVSYSCYR